jgi:signal transduction histidine kinase
LAQRFPFPVEIAAVPEERLPEPVEATAYFVVAEAITNVARYARASHAVVTLEREDDALSVTVSDDGVGGADPGAGQGCAGCRTASRCWTAAGGRVAAG